jgi:hypothetical protein
MPTYDFLPRAAYPRGFGFLGSSALGFLERLLHQLPNRLRPRWRIFLFATPAIDCLKQIVGHARLYRLRSQRVDVVHNLPPSNGGIQVSQITAGQVPQRSKAVRAFFCCAAHGPKRGVDRTPGHINSKA